MSGDVTFRTSPGGPPQTVGGAIAETLRKLIARGSSGLSSCDGEPFGFETLSVHFHVTCLRLAGVAIKGTRDLICGTNYALAGPVELLPREAVPGARWQSRAFEVARREPNAGLRLAGVATVRAIQHASGALSKTGRAASNSIAIARSLCAERRAYLDGAAGA